MKALRALSLLTIALRLSASGMSAEDRQHLMVHLQMTEQWLADEVRGLSPAQLSFRSAPDRWSVRECVSHLAVAEPDYWRDFMRAVKATPSGTKSSLTDADILWYGIDRVVHTKTGGGHEKVERYPEMAPALADFRKLRSTMLEYVRTHRRRSTRPLLWPTRAHRLLAVDAGNLDPRTTAHSADS